MMELLPDLPGTITGIKCKNPFIVQCPTCGDCYTSRAWTTVHIDYNYGPIKHRLCLHCAEDPEAALVPTPHPIAVIREVRVQ